MFKTARNRLIATALMLVAPFVCAGESAVTAAFNDAQLRWNPCPAFMPKGCGIAVLHGDPARANADVFFKVPAGATIPRHRHTSAERIVLVSGELTLRYEHQAPVKLQRGMYVYGPAGHAHEGVCAPGADCVLFIAFEAPVDAEPVAAGGN